MNVKKLSPADKAKITEHLKAEGYSDQDIKDFFKKSLGLIFQILLKVLLGGVGAKLETPPDA